MLRRARDPARRPPDQPVQEEEPDHDPAGDVAHGLPVCLKNRELFVKPGIVLKTENINPIALMEP